MLRHTSPLSAKFQPYAMALQMRFKWRHRVDENWRRLMDATCFSVDWLGRPRYDGMTQYGGNWSHFLCCAHCIAPWDYPNFYPPAGATRFVSKITATDCETQIRQPSMQGEIVYKTFASKFNTFIHRNPRLDLAVIHVEQAMKRTSEIKMQWMVNEGFHVRPRIEVLDELEEGDKVWIYGVTARGDVFDEESKKEPLMVPTGVRGTVKLVLDEHFFVDTSEDELHGNIQMGMCGSVVMKNGKCVGMLTATVASTNDDVRVANCAMCTHAKDIREFLLEVEQQMKNTPPNMDGKKTMFQERREAEGTAPREFKDWEEDDMRIARHVKVPVGLWKFEEHWTCEEDQVSSRLFGPEGGIFGKEEQEEVLGLSPQDTKDDGKAPEGAGMHNPDGSKPQHEGNRTDLHTRYRHTYLNDSFIDNEEADSNVGGRSDHVRDFYKGGMGAEQTEQVSQFARSMDAMRQQRERADLHETAMNVEKMKDQKKQAARKSREDDFNENYGPGFAGMGQQPSSSSSATNSKSGGSDNNNNTSEDVADRAAKHFSQDAASRASYGSTAGSYNHQHAAGGGAAESSPSTTQQQEQQQQQSSPRMRRAQKSYPQPGTEGIRSRGLGTDDGDLDDLWGKH